MVCYVAKKILRLKRHVIQTKEGVFHIDLYSNFGTSVLSVSGYEPELVSTIKDLVREGDVFMDVGANEGYYSINRLKIG